MFSRAFILALASSPLVAAHGKIAVVTGNAGGNTTGLGIQGGVVPGAGPNSKTEVDTTIFNSIKAQSNGLGKTKGQGQNTLDQLDQAQALSGSTLPQVSADGSGSLSGTYHIVTTDGAGPVKAVLDTTGTGQFADGTEMDVTTQVPGKNGNIAAPKKRSGLLGRALSFRGVGISKRAANVNEDFPIAISVPAGTTCSGTVNGIQNVCLMKIANSNPAGPFGGVVAFQMASSSTGSSTSSTSGNSTESSTGTGTSDASANTASDASTSSSSSTKTANSANSANNGNSDASGNTDNSDESGADGNSDAEDSSDTADSNTASEKAASSGKKAVKFTA